MRAVLVAWVASGAALVAQRSASLPSDPARMVAMQHHFGDVSLVLEAVIRGDLGAIREPASRLATLKTPPGVPAASLQYVAAISEAGRRAMNAQTIQASAAAAASLVRQCGECHLASSVRPVPTTVARPDVGGVVGHMLDHQRAADQLLQGLVIPSPELWKIGAQTLLASPLKRAELPSDPRLTREVQASEQAVHDIAAEGVEANTLTQRANNYGQLIAACSARPVSISSQNSRLPLSSPRMVASRRAA